MVNRTTEVHLYSVHYIVSPLQLIKTLKKQQQQTPQCPWLDAVVFLQPFHFPFSILTQAHLPLHCLIHVVAISSHRESQSDSACFTNTDLGNPEAGGLGIKVFLDSNGFMVSKSLSSGCYFWQIICDCWQNVVLMCPDTVLPWNWLTW